MDVFEQIEFVFDDFEDELEEELAKKGELELEGIMTFEKAKQEFIEDFNKIKGKRYKTNRKGNTGIGKTFEDIVGVEENNNLPIDYKGFIELKSQRAYTGSLLTLFTKSPNPYGVMARIRDTYGELDPKKGLTNILHSTAKHSSFNTYKGKLGFKLEIDRKNQKLLLHIKDLATGNLLFNHGDQVYWDLSDLQEIVETKCRNIAYVMGKSEKINGEEYFTFTKAVLLSGLTFESFLHLIEKDVIVFDIRHGTHSNGTPHDHGPAFRIAKRNIPLAFEQEVL
ncbi:MvaI/BcnI family restriction endonuclease [Caldifermentibacillus hisashii]|uniref:MvaI/BcnI family restriction endonuclease n=1 Tax=Caldifermentibacillus hisashii TaxID=996558 RepID=UPI0034D5A220